MQCVRFRLRTLLVVVALFGVGVGAFFEVRRLRRLSVEYGQRAALHLRAERIQASEVARGMTSAAEMSRRLRAPTFGMGRLIGPQLLARRLEAYHADLVRKYLRATRRPWETIDPDPPSPDFKSIESDLVPYIMEISARSPYLDLSQTSATDQEIKPVADWVQLKYLNLGSTKVTDEGLAALSGLKNLESLHLANTRVSDGGLVHLRELRSLKELSLQRTRVSQAGIKRLATSLPQVMITHDPAEVAQRADQ
jgi:hypothetical protein